MKQRDRISNMSAKTGLFRPLTKVEGTSPEPEARKRKRMKQEIVGTGVGVIGGAMLGAQIGTGIGIATAGWGMAATVPLGVVGGTLFGLVGNRVGLALDRRNDGNDRDGKKPRQE